MTRNAILTLAMIAGIVAFLGFLWLAVQWGLEWHRLLNGTDETPWIPPTPAQLNQARLHTQIYAGLAFVSAGSAVILTLVRIVASSKTSSQPASWH